MCRRTLLTRRVTKYWQLSYTESRTRQKHCCLKVVMPSVEWMDRIVYVLQVYDPANEQVLSTFLRKISQTLPHNSSKWGFVLAISGSNVSESHHCWRKCSSHVCDKQSKVASTVFDQHTDISSQQNYTGEDVQWRLSCSWQSPAVVAAAVRLLDRFSKSVLSQLDHNFSVRRL